MLWIFDRISYIMRSCFSNILFINFHIPGSNVSSGKEFGNGRKEIHPVPKVQLRSASEGKDMGQLSNNCEGTNSTVMRKWNFIFVNGCEYKNPISALTKLVWKWDECISVLGDHVENNITKLEYMSCTDRCSDFSFNFYDVGNLSLHAVPTVVLISP